MSSFQLLLFGGAATVALCAYYCWIDADFRAQLWRYYTFRHPRFMRHPLKFLSLLALFGAFFAAARVWGN